MFKKISLILLLAVLTFASIDDIEKKIDKNKKRIENIKKNKKNIDGKIKTLAAQIKAEEQYYNEILKVVEETNNELLLNRLKLANANRKLIDLKKRSIELQQTKKQIEESVVDSVVERYALSMGIELTNLESLKEIVDKEVYMMILDNAKQDVLDLNIQYLKISRAARVNEDRIKKLEKFVNKQEEIQTQYSKMQEKQEKIILSLKNKHGDYQKSLERVIDKQSQIKDLLGSLNILKKKEVAKEKERIRKAKALARKRAAELKRKQEVERKRKAALEAKKKKLAAMKKNTKEKTKTTPKKSKKMKVVSRKDLDKKIDIEVRKLGSSAKGIKISKYNGKKTMAPLKSYTITKKFGKYYDDVYNMELFSESVSLKTKKPNAKVYSVLKGQIVYAKKNSGLLENVVIVKHRNNLHTIYSHLDKISPTLRVGKWIPKGYVVGRVNDTLLFQATKNSKYIDPLKLFRR